MSAERLDPATLRWVCRWLRRESRHLDEAARLAEGEHAERLHQQSITLLDAAESLEAQTLERARATREERRGGK